MPQKSDWKQYRKTAKFHKALSNERRLALLEFLSDKETPERYAVVDLSKQLKIPYKLVSRHLQILDQVDLIERVRRGQAIGYQVTKLGHEALGIILL